MKIRSPRTGTIALRIRNVRELFNMPQSRLAHLAGINQSNLSNMEAGRRCPEIDALCRIADALGVSLDYLVGRVDCIGVAPVARGGNVKTSYDLA